jgi:hypothetical protein
MQTIIVSGKETFNVHPKDWLPRDDVIEYWKDKNVIYMVTGLEKRCDLCNELSIKSLCDKCRSIADVHYVQRI